MRRLLRSLSPRPLLLWRQTRHERAKLRRWKSLRGEVIDRYFASHVGHAKLQTGCGSNVLEGWLNTDLLPEAPGVIHLDASQPLPFRDNRFAHVFSEHQIEHIPYNAGVCLLRECLRVLQPGGRLRIATPDLAFLIRLYGPRRREVEDRYISWATTRFLPAIERPHAVFVINNFFRAFGHRFIYDFAVLSEAMTGVGFKDICRCRVNESDDPQLQGLETHGKHIGDEYNLLETFVVEGSKEAVADDS